jgi:hypothetical protein
MWSKEEVSIATGQSSLLHIVNVTHVDNGSYECELRSTIGRAIGTIDLVVLSEVANGSHYNTSALVKTEVHSYVNTEATVQSTNDSTTISGTPTVNFTSTAGDLQPHTGDVLLK